MLIDCFIVQLQVLDAIDKSRKLSSFDPHKFKHLDSFQRFVTSLGIPNFPILGWTKLKGSEMVNLNWPRKA